MTPQASKSIFEANLDALLNTTLTREPADSDAALIACVLAEVRDVQAPARNVIRWRRRAALAFATAAAIAIVVSAMILARPHGALGRVTSLYGWVAVKNGSVVGPIAEATEIRSGQWIETASGSTAEIELADKSRLVLQPRTSLQLSQQNRRKDLRLEQGSVGLEVAKQEPGKPLAVQTDAARIEVLGTKLDVHVSEAPDGTKQTRTTVTSGRVQIAAGEERGLLLPNEEAIAQAGKPLIRRSLTPEVNEIRTLADRNRDLAAERNVAAGRPVLIDYDGGRFATIWTTYTLANSTNDAMTTWAIERRHGAGMAAFRIEGARLPISVQDNRVEIDLSAVPLEPGESRDIVLKIPHVESVFHVLKGGAFECTLPPAATPMVTVMQLRLPGSVQLDLAQPEPIDTHRTQSQLVVTLATGAAEPNWLE